MIAFCGDILLSNLILAEIIKLSMTSEKLLSHSAICGIIYT